MSRNEVIVTCYVCRRERCSPVADGKGENTYQVLLICDVCLQEAVTPSEPPADAALAADTAGKFGERLREALAEVVAGRVEGKAWRTDDLSDDQVVGFVADLPDVVKSLAEKPLGSMAGLADVPAPAASPGADVMATFLLKPVLGPMESAVHTFEVAGIVIGLLTGLHPLVITCLKHLAYDEIGAALTDAVEQILSPADSSTTAMSSTAAASQRRKLATRPGRSLQEDTGMVPHGGNERPSPGTEELLRAGATPVGEQDGKSTIDHANSLSEATVSTQPASGLTHLA